MARDVVGAAAGRHGALRADAPTPGRQPGWSVHGSGGPTGRGASEGQNGGPGGDNGDNESSRHS